MLDNNNNGFFLLLPEMRKVAVRVLGPSHAAVDDVVSDTVVSLLDGKGLEWAASNKGYVMNAVKNTAKNVHRFNKKGFDSINSTDASTGEGAPALGLVMPGTGLEDAERELEWAAMQNAVSACLAADERTFISLVLAGQTAKDAAKAAGWTQVQATRRQPAILETLRAFLAEGEDGEE